MITLALIEALSMPVMEIADSRTRAQRTDEVISSEKNWYRVCVKC
jgi:hypothetical protein